MAAARDLLDRVFGRVNEQAHALAKDRCLPYTEADVEVEQACHESTRRQQQLVGGQAAQQ